MKDQKRKVYFSSLQVRIMLSHELETDQAKIRSDVFDRIVAAYAKAEESGTYTNFQSKIDDEVLMISKLHYVGDCLCGIVGRGIPKIYRFLRECNPETFGTKELTPSEGNLFEEYSFFAIAVSKLQMAFLNNTAISQNIPRLVVSILRNSLGGTIYEFEESTMLDFDIKKKLKQLSGKKITVKGSLANKEETVIGGMRSLKTIEQTLGTKMKAKVNVSARVSKVLTDQDIDTITELATTDEGFSSFTFQDEMDSDKEIIDVIRRQTYFTKGITLNKEEQQQPEAIWQKLCGAFR